MEDVDQLFSQLTELQQAKRLPPVAQWQPAYTGQIAIEIDEQGRWFHERGEIKRQPLIDLFATILRRDGDDYYLVTPAERLRIRVADAPFMAIDLDVRGEGMGTDLMFTTNVGDYVLVNSDHPITINEGKPYLQVRSGLTAKLTRNVYYRLVDYGVEEQGALYVYSQAERFKLGAV